MFILYNTVYKHTYKLLFFYNVGTFIFVHVQYNFNFSNINTDFRYWIQICKLFKSNFNV